ncbi:MAG: D-tyrosyl-tRNA(Tyr) deacylase [Candidatus Diapherotrites archaeon]|nr:D-tyrosyl-tRNA(Tyr) deacylase [Candidatus Diapherotrites archaeon]
MYAIVASKLDPAGMLISELLIEGGFEKTNEEFDGNAVYFLKEREMKLYFINEDQVYANYVDKIPCDYIIFASKHSSVSKRPTLTVHPIGNWGRAELGGKDFELVKTSAAIMKSYLMELQRQRDEKNLSYEVSYEATHHGPYLEKPTIYIELGSSIEQWKDKKAAEAIAETILETTKAVKCKAVLGFGGMHYNPHFTRIALQTEYAFSHMCAKYALRFLNKQMVEKAIVNTVENVEAFVIEKKGLAGRRKEILEILANFNIPILKTNELK